MPEGLSLPAMEGEPDGWGWDAQHKLSQKIATPRKSLKVLCFHQNEK
jgi:hypothetical protein